MKKIPIGISDFKTLVVDDFYYVDKSLFVKEIIDDGARVILLPRPRRFGKTLNMSLLKYFYEKTGDDNRKLFHGLNISRHKDIMSMQGKYPVIYLTFKDVKYSSWQDCLMAIGRVVSDLYSYHQYLVSGDMLKEHQKVRFNNIINEKANIVELSTSLNELCYYLHEYHNKKVIILIDEYDVPIQGGYLNQYYDKIIEFMRNFLSGGLKDNSYLEKAVLTGILRVSKESIFSGLNNLKVATILEDTYSPYFGFLQEEVDTLLNLKGIAFEIDQVKDWYNGYNFGGTIIYNPWSILNFLANSKNGYKAYWVNTSSNDLVKKLLTNGGKKLKQELEALIKGEEIVKIVNEDIVMQDIDKSTENIWSFLLFSGYLKVVKQELKQAELICNLTIPNQEVKYLYKQIILNWFTESISTDNFTLMLESLVTGDVKVFAKLLKKFVLSSVSYFDVAGDESEKVYHAFVLGMLIGLGEDYEVNSNRESGYGRYDVMIIPKDIRKLGIVIEFKKVDEDDNDVLEDAVEVALKQIEHKNYKQELLNRNVENILEIGIAFKGKNLLVKERLR